MSMNPGATTLPAASIVFLRVEVARFPMAATLPSRIPTSPEYHGDPVPSMIWPLVMTKSNGGGGAARAKGIQTRTSNADTAARIALEIVVFIDPPIGIHSMSCHPEQSEGPVHSPAESI